MSANNKLRFKRLVRQCGYKCSKCQKIPLMNNMLTVDHIIPRHHGVDRNNPDNLQLLCYRCHRMKNFRSHKKLNLVSCIFAR
jgi:5-methylcytosine-specific restriction endonuclease McrA